MKLRHFLASLTLAFTLVFGALAAPPDINGTAVTALSSTSDPTNLTSFSTTGAGVVEVACAANSVTVSGVSGGGLTFTQRANTGGGGPIETWTATSAGAVSSTTIAVDFSGAPSFASCVVFGIGTTTGLDANAGLPDVGTSDADATVSTTATDSLVCGHFRGFTENNATPGTWTEIVTDGYLSVYCKQFTSTQSSLAVPKPSGETVNGRIGDAFAGTTASSTTAAAMHLRKLNN